MKSITVNVIYYSPGPYGPMQHTAGHMHIHTKEDLAAAVRNIDSVKRRRGAGHIVLLVPDRDTRTGLAVQVAGYTWHRGAYQDVIPRAELDPYLKEEDYHV